MKKLIIIPILIILFLINIVLADIGDYGRGTYGSGGYGMSISPTFNVAGLGCPLGEFKFIGYCLPSPFYNIVQLWNQSIIDKWFLKGGVLEYSLTTPKQAIIGEVITINNLIRNEGDSDVEINCLNFLDVNNNGVIDINDSKTNFNKNIKINELVLYNTTLLIPNITGRYLVGGECELLNSEQPDAHSFTTIEINKSKPQDLTILILIGIYVVYKWRKKN